MKPSPSGLPWREDGSTVLGGGDPEHQVIVAEVYVHADRALIVRAVNAHTLAVKLAHAVANYDNGDNPMTWDQLQMIAEAALRAAGEEV